MLDEHLGLVRLIRALRAQLTFANCTVHNRNVRLILVARNAQQSLTTVHIHHCSYFARSRFPILKRRELARSTSLDVNLRITARLVGVDILDQFDQGEILVETAAALFRHENSWCAVEWTQDGQVHGRHRVHG